MMRTFSKIFGLGGMRIGWAYAPPAVIDVLNRVREPFNVSIAAQAAAIAALAEPGWVEKGRAHNAEYRPKLAAGLTAAGIKVWPTRGQFRAGRLRHAGARQGGRCVPAHARRDRPRRSAATGCRTACASPSAPPKKWRSSSPRLTEFMGG